MTLEFHEANLTFGMGPSGGTTSNPLTGESGPDGRVRICDLHPGDYRLAALPGDINAPESLASTVVSVRDRDVLNVTLQPVLRIPVPVRFRLDGAR